MLLLDEPTRGVDIATKAEIYRIISDLARSGLGVHVSSELEELVGICTRILVMRDGEIVAEVDGKDATEHEPLPRRRTQRCSRASRGGCMTGPAPAEQAPPAFTDRLESAPGFRNTGSPLSSSCCSSRVRS